MGSPMSRRRTSPQLERKIEQLLEKEVTVESLIEYAKGIYDGRGQVALMVYSVLAQDGFHVDDHWEEALREAVARRVIAGFWD